MKKTVAFFEGKGLALKADDHERVWYSDFLKFQKDNRIFATLMAPAGYGDADTRFDSFRNYHFSEILGFMGWSLVHLAGVDAGTGADLDVGQ